MFAVTGNALASPDLQIQGDFRLQGRVSDDSVGSSGTKSSWFQNRVRIGFTSKVDADTVFFARFSGRNDFGRENTSKMSLDQYGVKVSAKSWKFSLGRQDVNLGQGVLISTGNDASGVDNKSDGAIASTRMDKVNLSFIGGKTNSGIADSAVPPNTPAELYGFDASVKLSGNLTGGVAWLSSKRSLVPAVKTGAINLSFSPTNKFSLNGEFAKSQASNDNNAYMISGVLKSGKDNFIIQYNKIEKNSVDLFNSGIGLGLPFKGDGIDGAFKGFSYIYLHPIIKTLSFHAIYQDLKAEGKNGNDRELGTGLVCTF